LDEFEEDLLRFELRKLHGKAYADRLAEIEAEHEDFREWLQSPESRAKFSKARMGKTPWNKGLTKAMHPSLMSTAKKVSKLLKGKLHPDECPCRLCAGGRTPWNKGLTVETSEVLRLLIEKRLKTVADKKRIHASSC
jgi:hypothetical protein